MFNIKTLIISSISIAGLSACSSGSSSAPLVPLTDDTSTAVSALSVQSVGTGGNVSSTGSLDRSTGEIKLNGMTRTLSADGTSATGTGGNLSISPGNTEYVATFIDGSDFGVYGTKTQRGDVPISGAATYNGDSTVVVISADGVFDLTGDASFDVDFKARSATGTIDNLDGTLSTGLRAPSSVNDAATIALTDVRTSNNGLSGGDIAIDSDIITTGISGSETSSLRGQFYGPDADEIGGTFQLDDRDSGDLLVSGTFTGD